MINSLMLQKLLHIRSVTKLRTALAKQCLAPVSTQCFFNNKYNAVLLKESECSLHDTDFDYSATHHTIMELLDCSPGDAIHLIETDPDLLRLPAENLIEIKKLCKENRVPQDILRRNLTWVSRMGPAELNHRFLFYWKWSFREEEERPEILRILSLSLSKLTSLTCRVISEKSRIPQQNRVSYFSEKLDTSVSKCTDLIIKYPFLMTRNLNVTLEVVESLLDAGVLPQDIYQDPWPILYSPGLIKERLELFKQKDIKNIKPWMVRCKQSSMARCIEIRELAQQVSLEFDSKEEYLCERLGVDPHAFAHWKTKYPRVAQVSLSKLKVMLDILLSAGYEPQEIFRHAEVLLFSPDTIERRIKALGAHPSATSNLTVLSLNNRKFESYLNALRAHEE